MSTRRRVPLLLTTLAGMLVLTAPGALAQQKLSLRRPYLPGETVQVDSKMSMSVKLKLVVAGQNVESDVQNREEEGYREEVLSVDAAGAVTGIRRTYARKVEWTKEPDADEKQKVSSLQGKTVTVRRKGDKVTVDVEGGTIDDDDREALLNALDHNDQTLLPAGQVAAGDEWTVDPKEALKFFSGEGMKVESAAIRCRLQSVVDYAGQKCAQIRVRMDVAATPKDSPVPFKMLLNGDMYFALETGRSLGIEASGTVSIKGDVTENGMTVSISGEGPMKVSESRKWSKAPAR